MAGTRAGAAKTRAKNLANDPDFYAKIGAKSWQNPDRDHKTGFALMSEEKRREAGARGGKKTKNDYKTNQTEASVNQGSQEDRSDARQ